MLREIGSEDSGWATLQSMDLPEVEDVQAMLQPDEVLVKYYAIGDCFHAFILSRDRFEVVRNLTTTTALRASLEGLTFQLSKFHL